LPAGLVLASAPFAERLSREAGIATAAVGVITDPGSEDLMQPLEGVMVTLQATNAFIHGQTRLRGFGQWTQAGELRPVAIRLTVHRRTGFKVNEATSSRNSTGFFAARRFRRQRV
jgi:hypothetical protein